MKVHEFHTQRKNYHIIRSAYPMYRAADSPFVLQFYSFSRFCSMYYQIIPCISYPVYPRPGLSSSFHRFGFRSPAFPVFCCFR